MRGKRVLVVGLGNSAMDIACELCRPGLTDEVVISSRSPAWIMPKYMFGKPLDQAPLMPFWVPWRIRSALATTLLRLAAGKPDDYGLPQPDHPLLAAHPTVSQDLLGKFGSGDLRWKPNIQRFDGQDVTFEDDSTERFDVVVYCTGYNVSFPFLDSELAPIKDNDMPLWLRLVSPDIPNLFFLGLLQPLGAIMPLAEAQSQLIAAHLAGRCELPQPSRMVREMERERRRLRARYRDSARHTMQVDFDEYLWRVRRAMRRGIKQAGAVTAGDFDRHPFWSRMTRDSKTPNEANQP
jgi:hypothetical protein